MKLEVVIQENINGDIFDITELVESNIQLESNMQEQPGKITFNYIDVPEFHLKEGSTISFKVDDEGLFFGYVFKRGRKKDGKISITAYDKLRYLKNKDTYVLEGYTASQIFEKICADYQLPHNIIDSSNFVNSPKVHDNKSLYEIIQYAVDETLMCTGSWYMVRDNFGILEFLNVNSLKTTLFIGDESLATDFDFESSIDEDTYNQVKLIREDKEAKKREIYIVKDSDNISKWGLLQYFEKVDEKANDAQIREKADVILKLKNRETKKLKIPCIGNTAVSAGSGIILGLSDLEKEGIEQNKYFMVTSCSHTFTKDFHKMDLEMMVSI